MALLNCPECNHEVSEYAEKCPHCGYPLTDYAKKYKREQLLKNIEIPEEIICPLCGHQNKKNRLSETQMHCETCEADLSNLEALEERKRQYQEQQKREQTAKLPKCPTCGSTDLRKITATEKATSSVLFGLFGNKRKKQFHCNSCGYEW